MQASQIPPPPPPETPSIPPTPAGLQAPKRSRKKLWIAVALIVILVVAVVAFVFLSNPGGFVSGETIPLAINYNVGEKMTYSMTVTANVLGQTATETGNSTMEILSVEGNIYTIRTTTEMPPSPSVSYTMKMDKTGKITDLGDVPAEMQQLYSEFNFLPGYGSNFPKQEAKVGESWQIPLNVETSSISLQGTVNYKVTEVKSLTVPAGTYNVFKIEITIDNAHAAAATQGISIDISMNVNGYIYLEKGTGRTIQLQVDESITSPQITGLGTGLSMSVSMRMELTQHIQ